MSESFQIMKAHKAVIFGAGHGIGYALVQQLLKMNPNLHIHATFRQENKAQSLISLQTGNQDRLSIHQIDPLQESNLQSLSEEIGQYDILINSIGVLHDEQDLAPEKSLRDVDLDNLVQSFKINSAITPLIAKHFTPKRKGEGSVSVFATISAKVGSLSDNKMGGWYGYRASKSALNMFLINISREFERKKLGSLVLAIHPGTTITELSKPYTGKTSLKLHTPIETAINILNVIENKSLTETGKFYSWNGEEIPW